MEIINAYPIDTISFKKKKQDDNSEFESFVSSCIINLIEGNGGHLLNYDVEYCFTEEQAKEVVRRIKERSAYKKDNKIITYFYSKEHDMYVVEVRKNGRPSEKILRKRKEIF